MRVFGVIVLGAVGVVLLVFGLVGFFAHTVVDSVWMHVTGTAARIGGVGMQSTMEVGALNAPVWPSVVLALLAVVAFAAAFLLAGAGSRRRVPLRMSDRTPFRDRGRQTSPRPAIRRHPWR